MHPSTLKFDKDGYWSDVLKRQFVFTRGNVTCNTYLMIETFDDPKHKQVTLDAINMDNDNWVFGCKATSVHKGTRICKSGDNLSAKSFLTTFFLLKVTENYLVSQRSFLEGSRAHEPWRARVWSLD